MAMPFRSLKIVKSDRASLLLAISFVVENVKLINVVKNDEAWAQRLSALLQASCAWDDCIMFSKGFLIESSLGRSKDGGEFVFINFGDARSGEGRSTIAKTVIDGERRVTLECVVSSSQQIQFHWILNGKLIQNTTRRYQVGSNLFISRITRRYDEGDFNCIAKNMTSGFTLKSPPVKFNIICKSNRSSISF